MVSISRRSSSEKFRPRWRRDIVNGKAIEKEKGVKKEKQQAVPRFRKKIVKDRVGYFLVIVPIRKWEVWPAKKTKAQLIST